MITAIRCCRREESYEPHTHLGQKPRRAGDAGLLPALLLDQDEGSRSPPLPNLPRHILLHRRLHKEGDELLLRRLLAASGVVRRVPGAAEAVARSASLRLLRDRPNDQHSP